MLSSYNIFLIPLLFTNTSDLKLWLHLIINKLLFIKYVQTFCLNNLYTTTDNITRQKLDVIAGKSRAAFIIQLFDKSNAQQMKTSALEIAEFVKWRKKSIKRGFKMICDFRSILSRICGSWMHLVSVIHVSGVHVLRLLSWKSAAPCLWQFSLTLLWPGPRLVLLGIHSLESEMCLHFEHVTNYLLRLTLRDLAEAFTLLRCCLGQTYFRGLLSQFDCLYLTGVL